jgi:chaperone modulatory protein CbpM
MEELTPAEVIRTYYQVEWSVIEAFHQSGLMEVVSVDGVDYVPNSELSTLEKILRLHQDLEINLEGIEAISHLLEQMQGMQSEILQLRNKLRNFESRGHHA